MKPRHSGLSARVLSLLIAPLAVFPWTASAASHSKKQAKEVYAATDNSEMQPGFAMPVDTETGANLAISNGVQTQSVEAAPAPKKAKARATAAAAPASVIETVPAIPSAKPVAAASARLATASFDTVPASQSDAILQRLKIVENLVRKYGRAYDYRAHTLKELLLIQSTLESTAAPVAAPQAAVVQPAAPIPTAPVVTAPAPVTAAPAAVEAPAAAAESSDVVKTGQAAAVEENAEEVNLKTLPAPAEFGSNVDADQDN